MAESKIVVRKQASSKPKKRPPDTKQENRSEDQGLVIPQDPRWVAPTVDALGRYAHYWQTLSPKTMADISNVAEDDLHFVDPFNDVRGVSPVLKILSDMFHRVENPQFIVCDWGIGQRAGFLRWEFRFTLPKKRTEDCLIGMSEILFAKSGKAFEHIDHWDSGSQVYAKIPILGAMVRFVRGKLAVE